MKVSRTKSFFYLLPPSAAVIKFQLFLLARHFVCHGPVASVLSASCVTLLTAAVPGSCEVYTRTFSHPIILPVLPNSGGFTRGY